MPSSSPIQVFEGIKRIVDADNRSEVRLNANGGNSILVVCDPEREGEFVQYINHEVDRTIFEIIDLNQIFASFVEDNKEQIESLFDYLQASVHQIFMAPPGETAKDLFSRIVVAVANAMADAKVPVLINTGVLFGAGIDNIQIMEHDAVMRAHRPMVVLYPATIDGDQMNFLGKRPASRYRCMVMQ